MKRKKNENKEVGIERKKVRNNVREKEKIKKKERKK